MLRLILYLTLSPLALYAQFQLPDEPIRFLALGDSYTIGQSVPTQDRWPVQLMDSLVSRGYTSDELRIIATTGWRTDNLINAIKSQDLESQNYNLVSLLIGVNNQYQGRPFSQYATEFPALVDSAIRYAGGDKSHVFIVSIPDYAFTPFGQGSSNPGEISQDIDQYNEYSKHIADSLQITYFNITPISRLGLTQPSYVAGDGLHPSGIQYTEWVKLMLAFIDQFSTQVNMIYSGSWLEAEINPNPSSGHVTIRIPASDLNEIKMIQIMDVDGRVIMKKDFSESVLDLSIENLAAGLYFLSIKCGDKFFTENVIITGK